MKPYISIDKLTLTAPGRVLIRDLSLSMARERVALVGRNGVGKTTLLEAIAEGTGGARLVPQLLPQGDGSEGWSPGQRRRHHLARACKSRARVLLLDEPSDDLDAAGVAWLRGWLQSWPDALVVATHDARLLQDFREFFLVQESGCQHFSGSYAAFEAWRTNEDHRAKKRAASNLHALVRAEERNVHVARREARKKHKRGTCRARLNQKRDDAQDAHGKCALIREQRIEVLRKASVEVRRQLAVELPLGLLANGVIGVLGREGPVLRAERISAQVGSRTLFRDLSFSLNRDRLWVGGPNGCGKSTLLDFLVGRAPTSSALTFAGTVHRDASQVCRIDQGATSWRMRESLAELLSLPGREAASDLLERYCFPTALAQRPLSSLSPGERFRAALIALLAGQTKHALLVLDEPTFALDRTARKALVEGLRAWQGGLAVASHDLALLDEVGFSCSIALGQELPEPRILLLDGSESGVAHAHLCARAP
jgi:ATPase subunit of ABC transporter with duplicated ATPase domains